MSSKEQQKDCVKANDLWESNTEKQRVMNKTGVAGGKNLPTSTDLASPRASVMMDQTWKLTGNSSNDWIRDMK